MTPTSMTREEAIELLENLKVCKQAHTLFNIEKEAVDMAIEALKEKDKRSKHPSELEYMMAEKKRIDAIANEAGYGGEAE